MSIYDFLHDCQESSNGRVDAKDQIKGTSKSEVQVQGGFRSHSKKRSYSLGIAMGDLVATRKNNNMGLEGERISTMLYPKLYGSRNKWPKPVTATAEHGAPILVISGKSRNDEAEPLHLSWGQEKVSMERSGLPNPRRDKPY